MARQKHAPTRLVEKKPKEPTVVTEKKKRKWRPGTKALRQVRYQQKNAHKELSIPRTHIKRLINQVVEGLPLTSTTNGTLRFKSGAVDIIHESAEQFIYEFLTRANTVRCAAKVADKWGAALSIAKTDMLEPHKYFEADASNKITVAPRVFVSASRDIPVTPANSD